MPEFSFVEAARLIWTNNGLDLPAKAVATCLARHADREGCAWPSRALMAEEAGLSPRRVTSALASLESAGWIKRQNVPGKPARYILDPSTTFQGTLAPRARGVAPRARVPWHHVLPTLAPRATEVSHRSSPFEVAHEVEEATLAPRARVEEPVSPVLGEDFRRVAEAYRKIRGLNLISSTDQVQLTELLRVVPAAIVLEAFDRYLARPPSRRKRVTSVRYFEPIIQEVLAERVQTETARADDDDGYGGLPVIQDDEPKPTG